MRIIVFNGSPKGEKSRTNKIVKEVLKGSKENGADIENIFLSEKDVKECDGCLRCWYSTKGKCIFEDDVENLIMKMGIADIIIFATPLHCDNISSLLLKFLERTIWLMNPKMEKDKNGECIHNCRFNNYKKRPKMVIISNSGYPEYEQFQVVSLLFKRVARNFCGEIVGEIYLPGGQLLLTKEKRFKEKLNRYKKILRRVGEELARDMIISKDTSIALKTPLFNIDEHIKESNNVYQEFLNEE